MITQSSDELKNLLQDKSEMKKMNAMKKMKEGKYHSTKPGSLEEAVMSALSHPHIKG